MSAFLAENFSALNNCMKLRLFSAEIKGLMVLNDGRFAQISYRAFGFISLFEFLVMTKTSIQRLAPVRIIDSDGFANGG